MSARTVHEHHEARKATRPGREAVRAVLQGIGTWHEPSREARAYMRLGPTTFSSGRRSDSKHNPQTFGPWPDVPKSEVMSETNGEAHPWEWGSPHRDNIICT